MINNNHAVGTSIDEITGIINCIVEYQNSIAAAVRQQVVTVSGSTKAIHEAANHAKDITEGIEQVSLAANETADATASTLATAQHLSDLSNDLNKTLNDNSSPVDGNASSNVTTDRSMPSTSTKNPTDKSQLSSSGREEYQFSSPPALTQTQKYLHDKMSANAVLLFEYHPAPPWLTRYRQQKHETAASHICEIEPIRSFRIQSSIFFSLLLLCIW